MQDLTLVGMHDDGERLLLRTADGDRFTLAVDDALRAAVRGDRPRLGQLQLETERMRPRDIQARIRAGQTAEEVAAAGEVPLEYVRRYEGPVLAERAYVASQARRVQIRRGALAAAITPTLGDLVEERLRRREVDPEQAAWDSWRGDDGTWTVQLDFPVGEKRRQARWNYNPPLRQVTPLDDESRWLTDGDGRDREARPGRRRDDVGGPAADGGRRLTVAPVPSGPDGEQDLLDSLVEQESSPSLELLDTLRERRGRRIRPVHDADEDGPDPVESAIESILALRNDSPSPQSGDSPASTQPATGSAATVAPETGTAATKSPAAGPAAGAGRSGGSGRPATGSPAAAPTGRRAARGPAAANGRTGSNHPAGRALARDAERAGTTQGTGTAQGTGSAAGRPGSSPASPAAAPTGSSGGSGGTGRRAQVPEPGGSESPAARSGRPAQRRTQRTIEVPPVPPVQADPSGLDDREPRTEEPVATPATRNAPAARTGTRKNRRASVPSWDEIILGARRD